MAIYKLEPTRNPTDYIFLKGKTGQKDVRGELEEVTSMLFGRFMPEVLGVSHIDDMTMLDLKEAQDLFFLYAVIFELSGKKYIPGSFEIGHAKVVDYQKGSHLIAEMDPTWDVLERAHHTMEILYAMQAYSINVDPAKANDMWKEIIRAISGQDADLIPQMSEKEAEKLNGERMRENFGIIDLAAQFVRDFTFLNSDTYDIIEDHMHNPVYYKGVRYPSYVDSHELFSQIGLEKIESIMKSQPKDFFGREKKPRESGLIAIVKGDPETILKQFSQE